MIRYALRCSEGHDFDSWFRSTADFDRLAAEGQLSCAVCGGGGIAKALMTPSVPAERPLQAPASAAEEALMRLRRHVEENSDYVGLGFAAEARAMHEGEKPNRAIHGEARADEARKLIEDGVPVAPLPFMPRQRSN